MIRDAIGPVAVMDLVSGNASLDNLLMNVSLVSDCTLVNGTCQYGLMNDKGVRNYSNELCCVVSSIIGFF